MACSCKTCRATKPCLGRCDIPKHRCLDKDEIKPGPVPKYMGWLYNARDSPDFQLRCGWRPGHISCSVLRKMERFSCVKDCPKYKSPDPCPPPKCCRPCSKSSSKSNTSVCPGGICKQANTTSCPDQPLIRVVRHGGAYTICTKPSNVSNAPCGPYPLKYVLDVDASPPSDKTKYSVEGKFNNYQFDYTCSQASFVIDFTPPDPRSNCHKLCPGKTPSGVCSSE